MSKAHHATTPLGLSPWSGWQTACGRVISELSPDGDPRLADSLEEVDCAVCRRSVDYRAAVKLAREIDAAQGVKL